MNIYIYTHLRMRGKGMELNYDILINLLHVPYTKVCSSALLNSTRTKPVVESCHGGPPPDVVQSMPNQIEPYLDEHLNANPYCAPLVCNMSHPEVGCKTYQMGTCTSEGHFGTLSTNELEWSQSEPPWHGRPMQWSSTAYM